MDRPLALLALALLLALSSLAQAATSPTSPRVLQDHTLTAAPRDVAVSPSGSQIAVVTDTGLELKTLTSTGTIARAVSGFADPRCTCCAFTPNGRNVIIGWSDGVVCLFDRRTRTVGTKQTEAGLRPCGVFVVEDPPVAFLGYADTCKVAVVHYQDPMMPIEVLPMPLEGVWNALWVCGSGDGRFAYLGLVAITASPVPGTVAAIPYTAYGQAPPWRHNVIAKPSGCCIGPDPDHLLVPIAETDDEKVRIISINSGSDYCDGCRLTGFVPGPIAFTSDGYYAVIAANGQKRLRIVSGHDLRGRLDPNSGVTLPIVRQTTMDLRHWPKGVALHPTKPIAYVWSERDKCIEVVSLGIPGIEHP